MENMVRWEVVILGLAIATLVAGNGASQGASENPVVVIETSMGSITAELFADKAPKSTANFLAYMKSGFYTGTVFHRVIPGFMIQGGGMTKDLKRKPTLPPIVNEATNGLSNARGTLAMARTAEVNSATAQFFINVKDNAALNHRGTDPQGFGYAVFGKVLDGMEVVDKIERTPTGTVGSYNNVPLAPVVIKAVSLKK